MTSEYVPEVTLLADQLGYPGKEEDIEGRLKWLQTLPNHGLFVYLKEGKVKGWAHFEVVYDLIEPTMTEIKAIVVDENTRGLGIGHSLIEFSKKWTRERGLGAVYLSCNILRDQTHKFYQREGFSLSKTSHFFTLDL